MASLAGQLALPAVRFDPVAVLPSELASAMYSLLPVNSRLLCREVSPVWQAFLADARHWQVLDLSLTSGVARRSLALLRAASERAQGTLRELDVSGWYNMAGLEGEEALRTEQLLPILRANAASLLRLRAWKPVDGDVGSHACTECIAQVLVAAPRLRLLECDAFLFGEEARGPVPRLLCEPQFASLRVGRLCIDAAHAQPPPDVQALAAWAATHSSLKRLILGHFQLDSEPALAAVVDLAISQLQYLHISYCDLSPASLPALTRMLEQNRLLTVLRLFNGNAPLLVGADVLAFCATLRAARLGTLELEGVRLWESLADGLAVITACTGHPTLRTVGFQYNQLENASDRAAIEAALDTLELSILELRLTR